MSQSFSSALADAENTYFPDRWIALSVLQKGIRRSAVGPATAAASDLWQEPSKLFSRLMVIALEDIGVGNLDLAIEAIDLATDSTWRRKLPDKGKARALELVGQLCTAPKSRFADEVGAIACFEPALSGLRHDILTASDLAEMLRANRDIGVRALAAWHLAGTSRYLMDGVLRRQGDLVAVWDVFASQGVPAALLEKLDRAARRMPWTLAIL